MHSTPGSVASENMTCRDLCCCYADRQGGNAKDWKFCVECGSMLVRVCAQCGHHNSPKARFCIACSSSVYAEPQLQRLIPAAPAEAGVLSSRAAREGERKHLTVLIADIAGSTALVDHLDAEDAAHRLGAIVAQMREAVARFEGTVTKLQGDGVVALFGAPILQEDHAVRACCAGLAMIENVRRIEGAPAIRVGINTGEVVVRAMSTDLSQQYEAMGRTVHVAARLEQEAPEFGVVISDATLQATAGLVDAERLGERHLRGISEKVPLHALRKIRPAIASQQFRISQKLSPFVGRRTEYLALMQALDEATAGASPVVGIVGEAGSGKSRLVFEFLEGCRAFGRPVLEARATGYGRASPLRPILDLTRTIFGIDEATSNEEAAGQVRATLHRHALGQDLPLPGLPWPPVDPQHPSDRRCRSSPETLDAVRHAARAFATVGPRSSSGGSALAHSSEPFVDALVDSIAGTTTLMLVNFRPGYDRDWMSAPFYRRIALAPLHADAVEAMLNTALAANRRFLICASGSSKRAGGNPFFAEELNAWRSSGKGFSGHPVIPAPSARRRTWPCPRPSRRCLDRASIACWSPTSCFCRRLRSSGRSSR